MSKVNGAKLKATRLADNLSQEQLGDAANVSDNTISNLENGKGVVSPFTFFRVCDVLGLNPVECII